MTCIVYSKDEATSLKLGERVVRLLGAVEKEPIEGLRYFESGKIGIIELDKLPIYEEELDNRIKSDLFVFLSRHKSSKGVLSFTVHPLGNWSSNAQAGGIGCELSTAAPYEMQHMLKCIKNANTTDAATTYEATHHGPLLKTPSFFVEVGGSENITDEHYDILARATCNYASVKVVPSGRVAIGIGGTHYPEKFTKLSLEGKYAFSHIMPRHACMYADMLKMSLERSLPKADCAVIDWKGVASAEREEIVKRLDAMGVEYVRA